METYCIINGELLENCYILVKESYALIIDPGSDKKLIIDYILTSKLKVVGYLITHHHSDHTKALKELVKVFNAPICNNKNKIIIEPFNYEILETKGHTNDSISFYFKKENLLFSGDFIFKESIGRCDFQDSSIEEMKKSLDMIKKYNKNLCIYPGHGENTTLGYEIKHNYFLE